MKVQIRHRCRLPLLGVVLAGLAAGPVAADDMATRRAALVDEIAGDVRMTARYLGRDRLDTRVLEAIETVPRHELVPRDQRRFAYDNRPLPIGYGKTISQPYIVAIMTELIEPGAAMEAAGEGERYVPMLADFVARANGHETE